MFQGTKSHGLVSPQFLCALGIFFGGNISLSKNALIEFHYNLPCETLSGGRDFKFETISELTADMSFQMERSTLLNLKRKSEQDKKSNNDIENSHDFIKKPGDDEEFENELKKDLFKELEHVKTDHSYVEPIVQDAETIEKETKKKDDEFFKLALKFSEIDSAAVEQKRQKNIIDLFDYLEDDKSQVIDDRPKTENIFNDDDYLFDSLDEQEIKIFLMM